MWPSHPQAKAGTYPNLPLIEGLKIVNANVQPADQAMLTEQYTRRAEQFIATNAAKPFFLYVAHSMPHVPIFAGESARGKSMGGLYGDVIQEIDASVGRIVAAIKTAGVDKNTVVIFTSDNGPWLSYGNHAGTAGPLREGKGTVWEGGVRVPMIASSPGRIPEGLLCHEPMMTIDLLPTIAGWIGGELPKEKIDGKDLGILFAGKSVPGERRYAYYYQDNQLQAVRGGNWKLMLPHTYRTMAGQPEGKDGKPGPYKQVKIETPELYDLVGDVGETKNLAATKPDELKRMLAIAEEYRKDLGDSLTNAPGPGRRSAGQAR
jgi:arylsulfatase